MYENNTSDKIKENQMRLKLEHYFLNNDFENVINKTLLSITDKEKKIIELRINVPKINNEDNFVFINPYSKISKYSGYSASSNRRILLKAFKKIQHFSRSRGVLTFLNNLENYVKENNICYRFLYRYLRKNFTYETYLAGIIKKQSLRAYFSLKHNSLI